MMHFFWLIRNLGFRTGVAYLKECVWVRYRRLIYRNKLRNFEKLSDNEVTELAYDFGMWSNGVRISNTDSKWLFH